MERLLSAAAEAHSETSAGTDHHGAAMIFVGISVLIIIMIAVGVYLESKHVRWRC